MQWAIYEAKRGIAFLHGNRSSRDTIDQICVGAMGAYGRSLTSMCWTLNWPSVCLPMTRRLPVLGYQQTQHRLLNHLRIKFVRGNINIYLHFISFLHIDRTQVVGNPSSCKTRTYLLYIVNIMIVYVRATQGARATATMIFTMLNRISSISAR